MNKPNPPIMAALTAQSLERLRLLESVVVTGNDGVLITKANPTGRPGPEIVYCNAAFTRMTGYTEAEILGRTPRLLQSVKTDRKALDVLSAALSRWEPIEIELLNSKKDGTEFWVQISIAPVANERGWFTHWVSVQRDISNRKLVEEANAKERLTRAENLRLAEQVKQIQDAERERVEAHRLAQLGTWRLAIDGKTMTWSEDTYALLGLDAQRYAPTVDNLLSVIQPADHGPVRQGFDAVFRTRTAQQIDFAIMTAAQQLRHLRIEARPVVGADGVLLGLFGFCQDITEAKKAELSRLRSERLRMLGQLTGGVAHDFNNLLTVTLLNLEEALETLSSGDGLEELLKPALHATMRGAELTSRLLAYARRAPLRPDHINLNRFFGDLSTLLKRAIGEQYSLELRLSASVEGLIADPGQLENAIMNLVINARDAMPGGGYITISAKSRDIATSMPGVEGDISAGRYAVIDVIDEGQGIAPDLIHRVIEPFFTTKPPSSGSGLGLSMVYGFAQQSGGHIGIASTLGAGTTVSIYLPLHQTEPSCRWGNPAADSTWLADGLRVLVVEDQVPVLNAVTRMLRHLGFVVTSAENATLALQVLVADPAYDLLFTDIVLPPPMNGRDLVKKARAVAPKMRMLLTSGYSEDGLSLAGQDAWDGFLPKPYGREMLRTTLSRIFAEAI